MTVIIPYGTFCYITICDVLGDWVYGLREGKGHEVTKSGTHDGEWKANNKHGLGTERSLVGTVYEGRWMDNQKSSRGMRKMVTGDQEEQVSTYFMFISGQTTCTVLCIGMEWWYSGIRES